MSEIRIGIEGGRRAVLAKADALGAPILVSANSLWNNRAKRFAGWRIYTGRDVALDSGGFVAMMRYGDFRWTIPQYIGLARNMQPSWFAQMDYCCEPEIATDASQVKSRVDRTARMLRECESIADGEGVNAPMPVLQGWHPEDYCNGPLYQRTAMPDLVGVGSICRREVNGPAGAVAVIEALDRVLPGNVKLHLFGVKSLAFEILVQSFPDRIASMDSMAWMMDARWKAYKTGVPGTGTMRADAAGDWYLRQMARIQKAKAQPLLPLNYE